MHKKSIIFMFFCAFIVVSYCENTPPIPPDFNYAPGVEKASVGNHNKVVVCSFRLKTLLLKENVGVDTFSPYRDFDGRLCTHVICTRIVFNNDWVLDEDNSFRALSELSELHKLYPDLKILVGVKFDVRIFNEITVTGNNTIIGKSNSLYRLYNNMGGNIRRYEFQGYHINADLFRAAVTSGERDKFEQMIKDMRIFFDQHGYIMTTDMMVENNRVSDLNKLFHLVMFNTNGTANTEIANYLVTENQIPKLNNVVQQIDFYGHSGKVDKLTGAIIHHGPIDSVTFNEKLDGTMNKFQTCTIDDFGYCGWARNERRLSRKTGNPCVPHVSLVCDKSVCGILFIFQLCKFALEPSNNMMMFYDEETSNNESPIFATTIEEIRMNNPKSVVSKVTFAMKVGLCGIMALSTHDDDFAGRCGNITLPLLKAVNYALAKSQNETGIDYCYYKYKSQNPKIVLPKETIIYALVNTMIPLSCSATGFPTPEVFITHRQEENLPLGLKKNDTIDDADCPQYVSTHTLVSLAWNVSGVFNYSCIAKNSAGNEGPKIISVIVRQKPYLLGENKASIQIEEIDLELNFTVPKPSIDTEKSGAELFCQINVNSSSQTETFFNYISSSLKICTYLVYSYVDIFDIMEDKLNEGDVSSLKYIHQEFPALKIILQLAYSGSFKLANLLLKDEIDFFVSKINTTLNALPGVKGVHMGVIGKVCKSSKCAKALHNFGYRMKPLEILVEYDKNFKTDAKDVKTISEGIKYVILRGYDLNWNTNHTGHNSPLNGYDNKSIINTIDYLMNNAISNLILDLPSFGYFYALQNASTYFGIHEAITGQGKKIGYNAICEVVKSGDWKMFWDHKAKVPFLKKGADWISFDNIRSVYEKLVELGEYNIKGIMLSSIDTDDLTGQCDPQNSILKLIKDTLHIRNATLTDEKSISKTSLEWIITTAVALCVFVIIVAGSVVYFVFKRVHLLKNEFTKDDLLHFLKGTLQLNEPQIQTQSETSNTDRLPYDSSVEIDPLSFEIDMKKILGSGAFGIVYSGRVNGEIVAVKTTKVGAGRQYILSLLSELKILIYVGKHPNIVSLVGASTAELLKDIVYVFVEFCPLGSLYSYLKDARLHFSARKTGVLTTEDLIHWSLQISQALAHLRIKKIIHGDLAARNVLLFNRNVAKLTDFGLSRKLYQYSDYMKKNLNEPLPWRWMSLESLTDLKFSVESDVWSYGITLWEIFSLAQTPFPGLSWSSDFVQMLKQNHRPSKPEHATKEIFGFMQKC